MALPANDELRGLLDWEPAHGVLSVYVAIDHTDRGQGWRIELVDDLKGALAEAKEAPHELRLAARATAERVAERFPENSRPPDARGLVGFVELTRDGDREAWWSSAMPPRRTRVALGRRPQLRPLIEMLDDGRRIGIAAVSGDFGRLLEWEQGELHEIEQLEIVTTGDWRERKAPQPGRGGRTGGGSPRGWTTSSGREQHRQRLEAHRERFLKEVADKVGATAAERGWGELVAFGEEEYLSELRDHLRRPTVRHVEGKNLISEPTEKVARRLLEIVPELNRRREIELIDSAEEAAHSGRSRGALGAQETVQALAEGRVEHLVLDGAREYSADALREALGVEGARADAPPAELLVEKAIRTGATVTPVEGEAAERLGEHGGVAAILRY